MSCRITALAPTLIMTKPAFTPPGPKSDTKAVFFSEDGPYEVELILIPTGKALTTLDAAEAMRDFLNQT